MYNRFLAISSTFHLTYAVLPSNPFYDMLWTSFSIHGIDFRFDSIAPVVCDPIHVNISFHISV